jgi:hypothetical protein
MEQVIGRGRKNPAEVTLHPTLWEQIQCRRKAGLAEVSRLIAAKEESILGLHEIHDAQVIARTRNQIGALKDQAAVARKVWNMLE